MSVVAAFEAGLADAAAGYAGAFDTAGDEPALRAANARFTGPSGLLTRLMKLMPELPKEQRRELGQRANQLKLQIEQAFEARLSALSRALRERCE